MAGLLTRWGWNPIFKRLTKGRAVERPTCPRLGQTISTTSRINMERSSGTPSSRQFDAPPSSELAFSSSSAAHAGGQGGGGTPPPLPQLNLANSYWSRPLDNAQYFNKVVRIQESNVTEFTGLVVRQVTASNQGPVDFLGTLERDQEDRENDPRSRIATNVFQLNMPPLTAASYKLSAKTLATLLLLKDADSAEHQSHSSTSSSLSAATAVQQDAAASGCCIPPSCTLL